jgi:CRISPR/Cas system-associated exonuclease Cas4 (RecB family)
VRRCHLPVTKKKAVQLKPVVLVQLNQWSYSRFTDYEQCPLKCKLKHIDKLREPDNEHTRRGTITHKLAEQFVRGQLRAYPKELGKYFKERFLELRKLSTVECEKQWAFDRNWNAVGWFDANCWVRIKMDAHHLVVSKRKGKTILFETTVFTIDYKTGRQHPEHEAQRSLYALGAFHMYPDAKSVHVEHWYLDSGDVGQDDYKASQLPELIKRWEQETRAMLNDKRFAPKPGPHCRYCHFRKNNGGPCQF